MVENYFVVLLEVPFNNYPKVLQNSEIEAFSCITYSLLCVVTWLHMYSAAYQQLVKNGGTVLAPIY